MGSVYATPDAMSLKLYCFGVSLAKYSDTLGEVRGLNVST